MVAVLGALPVVVWWWCPVPGGAGSLVVPVVAGVRAPGAFPALSRIIRAPEGAGPQEGPGRPEKPYIYR